MVDFVDVGSDPDERQDAVERRPQPDVRVFDDAVGCLQQPLDDDSLCVNAEQPHRNHPKQESPHGFDGMRSIGRRHVDKGSLWRIWWKRHIAGHMCIVRCERYPAEKSSASTPMTSSSQPGQPNCAKSPAGRSFSANTAASTASNQFAKNATAVKPRFAARRPPFHGLARAIGTAVSSNAPIAITLRMIVTLVRKSRALIGSSSLFRMLEGRSATDTDNYLIFL